MKPLGKDFLKNRDKMEKAFKKRGDFILKTLATLEGRKLTKQSLDYVRYVIDQDSCLISHPESIHYLRREGLIDKFGKHYSVFEFPARWFEEKFETEAKQSIERHRTIKDCVC